MNQTKPKPTQTGLEIAVIGMSGRFPQAQDIDTFWENLKNGKEAITVFTDEELLESGISPEVVSKPNYVKAKGYVENTQYFDSAFFNYTPREADVMDPQIRVFHEVCWHALENAGYVPQSFNGVIGLYAGYNYNVAWKIDSAARAKGGPEFLEVEYLNSLYFSTLLCYKLNLKGPGVTVNTACSTSLAAIHMAGRALLTGEAEIVLAGGVSFTLPAKSGYFYEEGMIMSPDGFCYPFEERAKGTASGNGVAVVVLKRLVKAIKDRDHIYAVIKGTAMNNDGNRKPGYTAPSVEAQAEVIKSAMQMAEISPQTITFIETHGTGTPLGDPIEFEALKKAFVSASNEKFCRLGTLKANIGHLDAAAGAAGFIKTALALYHRLIPPSIHFSSPSSKLDFENTPFYINTEPEEWRTDQNPLRAGVSSFGIGGTNVHVILEEAPEIIHNKETENPDKIGGLLEETGHLMLLSAKSPTALEQMTRNMAAFIKKNPNANMGDIAFTLQQGRHHFNYRQAWVSANNEEATELLQSAIDSKKPVPYTESENLPIVFMFPGIGTQHIGMGYDLYRNVPVFRESMDRCFMILKPLLGFDLKEILYPKNETNKQDLSNQTDPAGIFKFDIAQAVVFCFEYSLAQLLIQWGLKPAILIGYSFGEYVAASLAGVFSLKDALTLVALRGQLISPLPPGGMLSVPLSKEAIQPLLKEDVTVAIDNGESCIVAGPLASIDEFEKQMKAKRYLCVRLQTTHALHTPMMEPILPEFTKRVAECTLHTPTIPFISNVTGTKIIGTDAVNPRYWAVHLRKTVNFVAGMQELAGIDKALFLEVGPGVVLSTMMHQFIKKEFHQAVVNLVKAPGQKITDDKYLLKKIAKIWQYGGNINWKEFDRSNLRRRVPLPTYPFEKTQYRDRLSTRNFYSSSKPGGDEIQPPKKDNEIPSRPRHDSPIPYAAPRNPAEQFFIDIWEDILGIKPIGINDNLLEMGVNSLKGITFVNRFKEQLGEIIHITAIFDAPTVAELAEYFAKHYSDSFAKLVKGGKPNTEDTPKEPVRKEEVTIEKIMRFRRFLPLQSNPVHKDKSPNPKAVFVLSPPRTGSTLLRVILGGHPHLFAPPELNLLSFNTLQERKTVFAGPAESNLQGTVRALMAIKKCSVQQAAQLMEQLEQQDLTVKQFYGLLQEWIQPQLLVDKSPGYSNDLEILKRAELYFDNPLYIHLLRHPYGMIHSFVEAKMDLLTGEQLTGKLGMNRMELAEVIYTNSELNIMEFLEEVPEERQLQVKFEDLATQPEEIAKAICRFLNLEFHPPMVEPYREKNKRMTDGVYTQGQMIGDMKFHQHKGINAGVANHWQSDYLEDFWGKPTLEVAKLFGYKPIKEKVIVDESSEILVPLTKKTKGAVNIFFLHERSGDVGGYIELCRQLEHRFNCWGIQAEKLKYYAPRNITVQETAKKYIHQIKKIQPQGPYYLCAWSFGGNIAFEMTRQLEQNHEPMALLAFIDCAGPLGRLRQDAIEFSPQTEKEFLKEFFKGSEIEGKLKRITKLDYIWPFVADFLETNQVHVETLKNLLRGYANAIPNYQGLTVKELIEYLNTDRSFKNAGTSYIPTGKLETQIHFFTASKSKGVNQEYWNDYCCKSVKYYEVQGDHHSIFRQPGVSEFARILTELLESVPIKIPS